MNLPRIEAGEFQRSSRCSSGSATCTRVGGIPKLVSAVLAIILLSSLAHASPTLKKFDATFQIAPDYTYTVRYEFAQVAKNREELDELTRLSAMRYAKSREEVRFVEGYTLKQDGRRLAISPAQVYRQASQASQSVPMFDDTEVAQVAFPSVEVGDTAVVVWEKRVKTPAFPGQFFAEDYVCGCRPVEYNRLTFRLPANLPFKVYARGQYKISEKIQGNTREVTALLENFPYIPKARHQPGDLDMAPNFLVATSFPSWEEVGAAYWARARDKAQVTPEVGRIADEAAMGAAGLQLVENLYNWVVKNLRYVGIFLGDGGYVPMSVGEILKNRYGDCKAYTTLLQALLAAKGIESQPVLVYLGTDGYKELPGPTPRQFNHAMLYVPRFNLFLDPTNRGPFGTLLPEVRGKFAVLAGNRPQVVRTPAGNPQEELYRQESDYKISLDGSLSGLSTLEVRGGWSGYFRSLESADASALARNILSRFAEGGSGSLMLTDLSLGYRWVGNWNTPNLVQISDLISLSLPQGLALFYLTQMQEHVAQEFRSAPLIVGARTDERTYRVQLPEGYKLLRVPAAVNLSNPSGSYQATYEQVGSTLIVWRRLVLLKDIYSPDEYPVFRELVLRVLQDLRTTLVFSK